MAFTDELVSMHLIQVALLRSVQFKAMHYTTGGEGEERGGEGRGEKGEGRRERGRWKFSLLCAKNSCLPH